MAALVTGMSTFEDTMLMSAMAAAAAAAASCMAWDSCSNVELTAAAHMVSGTEPSAQTEMSLPAGTKRMVPVPQVTGNRASRGGQVQGRWGRELSKHNNAAAAADQADCCCNRTKCAQPALPVVYILKMMV